MLFGPRARDRKMAQSDGAKTSCLRHWRLQTDLLTVDIEVEVFVLNGFVLAVGADGSDGGVDLVQISLVALAHRDAYAVAEVVDVGEGRTDKRVALALIGVEEAILQQGGVCHGTVQTTGADVQVDLVLRAVRLDFST